MVTKTFHNVVRTIVFLSASFLLASPVATAQDATRSSGSLRWGAGVLQQKPDWYASEEARAIANSVLQYQSPQGGWPKSTNLAMPPNSPEDVPSPGQGKANSLDNNATTLPMKFLARMASVTGEVTYREAFKSGVDYLLAAQYSTGGWPQFYPLRKGYYSHITYNDGAMMNVITVLHKVAAGEPPYDFVDAGRRTRAATAVERGIECILQTQVRQDGQLTAWCAQYDETTLKPAWARKYEPPSLSGGESVGIVRFLMEIEQPTPEIIAAIEGAVAWLRTVAIRGKRIESFTDADGNDDVRVVDDPTAGPIWARFYELGTNRPIFLGRNSITQYDLQEIERERREGYSYYGMWATSLLDREYPRWRAKHKMP